MEAVRITGLGSGGEGVGRLADGRAVFIPRTAPGDLVIPAHLELHARFARARVGRLVEPGPGRVAPQCGHYLADDCGGCQLQHLDYPTQLEAKRTMVRETLRRVGGVAVDVPEVVPGNEWGYRTRFAVAAATTGTGYGFHRQARPGEVFPLVSCPIARPEVNRLWTGVSAAPVPGVANRLTLRLDRAGAAVVIHGATRPGAAEVDRFRDALAAAGHRPALWWQPAAGPVTSLDSAAGSAPSFSQVDPALGDRVRRHAVDGLGTVAGREAWDLYAGAGEASRLLAERGATVQSVELDHAAVAAAERQAPHPAITRHAGRVEDRVAGLRRPHLVYANPPRAGLGAEVVAAIMAAGPERMAYVSCDPATLARDLKRFARAYRIVAVQPFDLFPQTAHVETVVQLEAA